jgi:hypothetical protein
MVVLWHDIAYFVSLGLFWLLHLAYHCIAICDKFVQWADTAHPPS